MLNWNHPFPYLSLTLNHLVLEKKNYVLFSWTFSAFSNNAWQSMGTEYPFLNKWIKQAMEDSFTLFPHTNQFSSVQLLTYVRLFGTPWIAAHQASLSNTTSRSLLKLMSFESVMPSSHLILCRPLLLLPPIPPSIRVLSNESTLRMRWPKYWSSSFSISPSNEHPGLISSRMDWFDLLAHNIQILTHTNLHIQILTNKGFCYPVVHYTPKCCEANMSFEIQILS